MSRYPVIALIVAAILQCLPQTALAATVPQASVRTQAPVKTEANGSEGAVEQIPLRKVEVKVPAAAKPEVKANAAKASEDDDSDEEEDAPSAKQVAVKKKPKTKELEKMVRLNLEGAQKAFGEKFGIIEKNGQFYLKGVTTPECADKGIYVAVKGTDVSISVAESCADLPEDLETSVDLSETPIGMKVPKKTSTICLLSENVRESGSDRHVCDPLAQVKSKADAVKEKNDERALALREVITECEGSNSLADQMATLNILKLEGAVLGRGEAKDLQESILDKLEAKTLSASASSSLAAHRAIEQGPLNKLYQGSPKHQEAAFNSQVRLNLSKIFNQDLSLEERKKLALELGEELEMRAIDLDISEEAKDKALKTFRDASGPRLAQMERGEKVQKAGEEMGKAAEALNNELYATDPRAFAQAKAEFDKTLKTQFLALGCGMESGAKTAECQQLVQATQATKEAEFSRGQLITLNGLRQACEIDKSKNPAATCDLLAKHEETMKKNPRFKGAAEQKAASEGPVQLPTLASASAAVSSTNNGVTLENSQFTSYSQAAAGITTATSQPASAAAPAAATQQTVTPPAPTQPAPPAAPAAPTRTVVRRR